MRVCSPAFRRKPPLPRPFRLKPVLRTCAPFLAPFAIVALFVIGPTLAHADLASDQAAIDRLVEQGKLDHAEMLCREQLQTSGPQERQAALTAELIRILTAKARQSTMVEADTIFRQSKAAGQSYLDRDQSTTQRWLVEFQLSLLPRLRGDLRQWQMGGVRGDALHLQYLRDSIKQLRSLAERLDKELRRRRGKVRRGELSSKALQELRARILLELGKTYRAQAESYAAESNDRALAAAEGDRVLQRIAPTAVTPDLWWRTRMEQLACMRLKSDWSKLARRVEVMMADRMPPGGKAELRAEAVRVSLARKRWSQVKTLVASGVPDVNLNDPRMKVAADELGLAYVEAYLALATYFRQRGDDNAARDYETRAAEAVDARKGASPYWTRRVESLLARGATDSTGGTRLSGGYPLTERAARGLFRQGKLAEAAQAYRRAAKQAGETGNRNKALSLTMTAAGLLVQSQQNAAAAKLLQSESLGNADLPAAAEAHLLAIKLTAPKTGDPAGANESAADPSGANAEDYARLLNEHLKWWPRGKTSDQVAWWRGRAAEHDQRFAEALNDYLAVSASFADPASVTAAIERCARNIAGQSASSDATANGASGGLVAAVRGLVDAANAAGSSAGARDAAALAATRIALLDDRIELAQPVAVLQQRLSAGSSLPDNARMVLAEAQYRMGRRADAEQTIARIGNASPAEWLRLLQSVSPKATATRSERQRSAAWRLLLADRGEAARSQLVPQQQLQWDRLHVLALGDLATDASLAQAEQRLSRLLKQLPKDASLRELNARVLSSQVKNTTTSGDAEGADSAVADKALKAWRTVVAGSPPKSQRWYEAKYNLAKLHLQIGDKNRAAQMIELLQALHPDLGGTAMKGEFMSLLKQCE